MLVGEPCKWTGWSLVEYFGTVDGDMQFWDGNPAGGGTKICTVKFAAAGGHTVSMRGGIKITKSLWCDNSEGGSGGAFIGSITHA